MSRNQKLLIATIVFLIIITWGWARITFYKAERSIGPEIFNVVQNTCSGQPYRTWDNCTELHIIDPSHISFIDQNGISVVTGGGLQTIAEKVVTE